MYTPHPCCSFKHVAGVPGCGCASKDSPGMQSWAGTSFWHEPAAAARAGRDWHQPRATHRAQLPVDSVPSAPLT